jgi:hypothetical protein
MQDVVTQKTVPFYEESLEEFMEDARLVMWQESSQCVAEKQPPVRPYVEHISSDLWPTTRQRDHNPIYTHSHYSKVSNSVKTINCYPSLHWVIPML